MIAPVGATSFFDGIKVSLELLSEIKKQVQMLNGCNEIGGSVVRQFKNIEEMLDVINEAIHTQGMEGKIVICINVSAHNFA